MSGPLALRVERRFDAKEANTLLGTWVPEQRPTLERETIAYDADTGEPVFAYLDLGRAAEQLRSEVLGFSYTGTTARANGSENVSRTFGYAPRRPVYGREGCQVTRLANEAPSGHAVLEAWADVLRDRLEDIDPTLPTVGALETSEVYGDWKMGQRSYWTSGVINQSSQLPYHRDGFNFQAWSAMPVFRRNMRGGYLAIPEYGAVLPCRDSYAVFFPGWKLVHGVTPMKRSRPDGYRYSVVYYSLKGMRSCFEYALEQAHAREARTARERKMADELRGRGA